MVVVRKPKRGSGSAQASLLSQLNDMSMSGGLGGWGAAASLYAPARLVVGPAGLLSPVAAGGGMGGVGGVGAVPFAGFGQASGPLDVDVSFG